MRSKLADLMFNYLVYDVFTDRPFCGNQLAVFPDARDIPEDKLQFIAAEFNFSEVTFIYPPHDTSNTARLRIFTPTHEVDFAGHPIIGTVIALSDLGREDDMTLELGIGNIACKVENGWSSFTAHQTLERLSKPDPHLVAKALRVSKDAIVTKPHVPIIASLGLPFVLVELSDLSRLSACLPEIEFFREGAQAHPESHDFAIFAYVREGDNIRSRMFAPLDNIPEDPATGSATATLSALLTELLDEPQSLCFLQGVEMGRPSIIQSETTLSPMSVTISGQAVKVMQGVFSI